MRLTGHAAEYADPSSAIYTPSRSQASAKATGIPALPAFSANDDPWLTSFTGEDSVADSVETLSSGSIGALSVQATRPRDAHRIATANTRTVFIVYIMH